ncbi:MAG: hypothetical protein SVR08_16535 [Spirochaetota bacterium]|nr:hypothetical protein [Spirochaetota bacterium]
MDNISQIGIVVFGCSAIWLVGRKEHWSRWGYIIGLISQPFWFYTSIKSQQWGIVLVSCWYTYAWCQGLWNYWIKAYK